MSDTFDVVVIGSGPGGYVAAIRCAQLGLKTACVERAELGGICLNWGCIPTKALLKSAEVLEYMHRAKEFGVIVEGARPDFPAIIKRSRDISDKISKGVGFLLKKNKIEHVPGTAKLTRREGAWKPHKVAVALTAGGTRTLETKNIIIATGARARSLPGMGARYSAPTIPWPPAPDDGRRASNRAIWASAPCAMCPEAGASSN